MMMRLPASWRVNTTPQPVPGLVSGLDSGPVAAIPGAEARPLREPVGFRLVEPSGNLTPAIVGNRASRRFTAIILLDDEWELDVEAVAATVALRFPTIGHVDARPGAALGQPGAVLIDGATVTMQMLPGRVPSDRLSPALEPVRGWDPEPAIRRHVGALEISCGGELAGLEGAEAYAAAVHFVATAACRVAAAGAVLWRDGWVLSSPEAFAAGAEMILGGHMPLHAWVSFAHIVPRGYEPADATGMVSYGMRPFIGRELELAPRPCNAREAQRAISRVARRALESGLTLEDGQQLSDEGELPLTVRERTFWLRRDQSAYVLVAADSVVDAETLKPRSQVA